MQEKNLSHIKKEIADNMELVLADYIRYSIKGEDSNEVATLNKEDIIEYLNAMSSLKKAYPDCKDELTKLIAMEEKLFPYLLTYESMEKYLSKLKEYFDMGLVIDNDFIDSDNIEDCIMYYQGKSKNDRDIYDALYSNLSSFMIAIKEKNEDDPVIELYMDERNNMELELIERGTLLLKHLMEIGEDNPTGETMDELSESICNESLNHIAIKFLLESVESAISTSWSFIKGFREKKDDNPTVKGQEELMKSALNHIAVLVTSANNKEELTDEDVFATLNALIPLSAILNSFEEVKVDEEKQSEIREAMKEFSSKINGIDLKDGKEKIDNMIQTVSSNFRKSFGGDN